MFHPLKSNLGLLPPKVLGSVQGCGLVGGRRERDLELGVQRLTARAGRLRT